MNLVAYNDTKISKFSLGTVQFGLDYGIANSSGKPAQDDVNKIIHYVSQNGINCFDTAQAYGNSEEVLGKALKNIINPYVISKFKSDVFYDDLTNGVDCSLKNLKTNTLYALLLHDSDPLYRWKEGYSLSIKSLIDGGKIKYFGVSIYSTEDFNLAIRNDSINIIQIPFNIFDQRALKENWFEKAKEKNKLIFIRSVYLQGLLLMQKDQLPNHLESAKVYIEKLEALSNKLIISRNELALNFVNSVSGDSVILFGCDSLSQAKENINIFNNLEFLDNTVINKIKNDFNNIDESIFNPTKW